MKPHLIFTLHHTEHNSEYAMIAILIVLTVLSVLYHVFTTKSNFVTLAYGILSFAWAFTIITLS